MIVIEITATLAGRGRLFLMRKNQYRKDKTDNSYDQHKEIEQISVCNVMHGNPSFTIVIRGTDAL